VQSIAEDIFGNREKVDVACPACGKAFLLVSPKLGTLRIETTRSGAPTINTAYTEDGRLLELPQDKEISLRVLEGDEAGTVFAVARPRITIGRSNADIILNDRAVSRLHCALEISRGSVLLRDLGSMNGTIVGNQLVETATLTNGSTFRVGMHILQLQINPKEA
jgi:pSer/pThr/pTyr-binding forkhead associated (FHA) protein